MGSKMVEIVEAGSIGAIVCHHVAKLGYLIMRAERDNSAAPEDSGWQFLCNSGEVEREDEAQVWALGEVLDLEPSLEQFMTEPAGTVIARTGRADPWKIVQKRGNGAGRRNVL